MVGPEFQCIHVHEDRGQNLTVHIPMAEVGGGWGNGYAMYMFRQQKGQATVMPVSYTHLTLPTKVNV